LAVEMHCDSAHMYVSYAAQHHTKLEQAFTHLRDIGALQGVSGKVKERMQAAAEGTDGGARPMLLFPEVSVAFLCIKID